MFIRIQRSATFLGYEEYKTTYLYNTLFTNKVSLGDFYYGRRDVNITFVPVSEVESLGFSEFDTVNTWIPEHPELLDTAKTVYIHPSCEMPRTFALKKYKKVLNPWAADVVVYPDMNKMSKPNAQKYAIFINDDAKIIAYSPIYEENWQRNDAFNDLLDITEAGTSIASMAADTSYHIKKVVTNMPSYYKLGYDINEVLAAKLVKCDNYYIIHYKDKWLMDILMSNVPKSKVVYENTLMATLNDADNQVTAEVINSIMEMLDSSDAEIVTAGMKALAALDYSHYPNSVRYALHVTSKWRYNNAYSSTAFKYMYKQLGGRNRRNIYFPDNTISKEDYDVLYQVAGKDFIERCPFSYRDGNYDLQVRFKS